MQNLFLYLAGTEKFGNCFRFGNNIINEMTAIFVLLSRRQPECHFVFVNLAT